MMAVISIRIMVTGHGGYQEDKDHNQDDHGDHDDHDDDVDHNQDDYN